MSLFKMLKYLMQALAFILVFKLNPLACQNNSFQMNCTATIALLYEPVVCFIQTIRYSQNLTINISINANSFNYTNIMQLTGNKKTYVGDFEQTENKTVNSSIFNLTFNENSFLLQTILFDDDYYLNGIEFNSLKSGLITFGIGYFDDLLNQTFKNNLAGNQSLSLNNTVLNTFDIIVAEGYNYINYTIFCPKNSFLFYKSNETIIELVSSNDADYMIDLNNSLIKSIDSDNNFRFNLKVHVYPIYVDLSSFTLMFNESGTYDVIAQIDEPFTQLQTQISIYRDVTLNLVCPEYILVGIPYTCTIYITRPADFFNMTATLTYYESPKTTKTYTLPNHLNSGPVTSVVDTLTKVHTSKKIGTFRVKAKIDNSMFFVNTYINVVSDSTIDIRCSKSAFINQNITCLVAVNSERQTITVGFTDGYPNRAEDFYTSSTINTNALNGLGINPIQLEKYLFLFTINSNSYLKGFEFFSKSIGTVTIRIVNLTCTISSCTSQINPNQITEIYSPVVASVVIGYNYYQLFSKLIVDSYCGIILETSNANIVLIDSILEQYQFNSGLSFYEKITNSSQKLAFNPVIEGDFYKRELIIQTSYPTIGVNTIKIRIFDTRINYSFKVKIFYELLVTCNPTCNSKQFYVQNQTDSLSYKITTVYDQIDFYVNYGDGFSETLNLNNYANYYLTSFGGNSITNINNTLALPNITAEYYFLTNTEFTIDAFLKGFIINANQSGFINLTILEFDYCGTTTSCSNYFSANPLIDIESALNKSRIWQLYLNYGLNNISLDQYTSERIHYEPGAIFCFWSNDGGFIALDDYDPNLIITDYYVNENKLIPLVSGSVLKFSVQIIAEKYSKDLIITANANNKIFFNSGVYSITSSALYGNSLFAGPTQTYTIIDDPIIFANCSYVFYEMVSCEYNYFAFYNITVMFIYPLINLTEFMNFNGTIQTYTKYYGISYIPDDQITQFNESDTEFVLISTELSKKSLVNGFDIYSLSEGYVNISLVSLDACGINFTCNSYFSDANNPKTNLTGINFINSWRVYLSKGSNNISLNGSFQYDKGVLAYLKLEGAVVALDSSFAKNVKDYQKFAHSNDSFDLVDLSQANKYTFCVKIITTSYSYRDANSFIKALNFTGSNILTVLFYNEEFNYYYNKTFNIFVPTTTSTTTTTTTTTTTSTTTTSSTTTTTTTTTTTKLTTTSTTTLITPNALFGPGVNSTATLNLLNTYTGDLSGCLTSCSARGICGVISNNTIGCVCSQSYYYGTSCEFDSRPCTSSPCLNNGTCLNGNGTLYSCECQNSFYGSRCEYQVDLCANNTCSGNGYCSFNSSTASCKCFAMYEGKMCDKQSSELKAVQTAIKLASIIAILVLILFYLTIVLMDYFKYFEFEAGNGIFTRCLNKCCDVKCIARKNKHRKSGKKYKTKNNTTFRKKRKHVSFEL